MIESTETFRIIDDTTRSIRRAKPKQFVVISDGEYKSILTGKEFAALRLASAQLHDAGADGNTKITPKLIAKLVSLMDTPPYFETPDGDSFARKDVEKAKHVSGVSFTYEERTATLLSNGLLVVGCQKHPLSVWASTEPNGFGAPLAQYLSHDNNAAARDALIPVLRAKLKELKAA